MHVAIQQRRVTWSCHLTAIYIRQRLQPVQLQAGGLISVVLGRKQEGMPERTHIPESQAASGSPDSLGVRFFRYSLQEKFRRCADQLQCIACMCWSCPVWPSRRGSNCDRKRTHL